MLLLLLDWKDLIWRWWWWSCSCDVESLVGDDPTTSFPASFVVLLLFLLLLLFSWEPLMPSCSFISSMYISSTIGFHSRTLAFMNQFDTCMRIHSLIIHQPLLFSSKYIAPSIYHENEEESNQKLNCSWCHYLEAHNPFPIPPTPTMWYLVHNYWALIKINFMYPTKLSHHNWPKHEMTN